MKKLNIGILATIAFLFIISCGDNDEVINGMVSSTTVSGNAQYYYSEDGLGTLLPSVSTPVFLGETLVDIDTSLIAEGEVFFGEGWYGTRTDENGYYQFEDIEPFENWQIHLLVDVDSITGGDMTPDGDVNEDNHSSRSIAVSVELDELDDGNNFEYYRSKQYYTTISGLVDIDDDKDGVADRMKQDVRVTLHETDASGNFDVTEVIPYRTYFTNVDGAYKFENVKPGFYTIVFNEGLNPFGEMRDTYQILSAEDLTPDTDPLPSVELTIPVFIEEGEDDDQNNFTIQFNPFNIGGYVLRDLDGDGIGDSGAINESVQLYARGEGGEAEDYIAAVYTELDGFFSFKNVGVGEYILVNNHSSLFDCVSSMDLTPESSEPIDYEGCRIIASDVSSNDFEDAGNQFIVEYNFKK